MKSRHVCFAALLAGFAAHAASLPYEIRTPASAKPYERNAARELGNYLARRISGSLTVDGATGVVFHGH